MFPHVQTSLVGNKINTEQSGASTSHDRADLPDMYEADETNGDTA